MICPKCGRPVQTAAVICAGCDFILDTDFLGSEILDEEQSLRPGRGGIDPAVFNLADAVILGDIDDEAHSFETADSGFHIKESTNARLYVSGRSQAMMAPDAVPAVLDDAPGLRLTPFEKHVLSFIDGKRPVEAIRRQAGLDEVEVKTALATLADKEIIAVVGRALVEADTSLETSPRLQRRRVRGAIAGAVGAGYDDTDRAIEDAFRTQTNLRALSELSHRESLPASTGGAFADGPASSHEVRKPKAQTHAPRGGTSPEYNFESDAETQAREVTGLRQELSEALPSDADRFTVPGLGLDARSLISETPDLRKRKLSTAATLARLELSGSDGFDDFGAPSQLSSVFVNDSESQEHSIIDSDHYSDLMSESQPDLDPPTRPVRSIDYQTVPSVSEVSFISSIEEDEASGVMATPNVPLRFRESNDYRNEGESLHSAISFISEEAVIELPDSQTHAGHLERSYDSDDQATQVLPDIAKKVHSFSDSRRETSSEEDDAYGAFSQEESDTARAAQKMAGASVDHRRARAAKLFEDAQNDFKNGRLAAARMHGKLACLYDPGNKAFRRSLNEWEQAATRRQARPSDSSMPPAEFTVLYERAQQLEADGQHENAAATLQNAARLFPNIAAIHNRLGVLLALRMKDYDTAVAWIRKAIELEPDNLHYRNNLGKIEVRRRRVS